MGRYILKRLLQAPVVLLLLITISFFMMRAAPGGPFDMDKKIDPDIKKRMEAKFHLDEPPIVQFGYFLLDLAKGDLGPSFKNKSMTVNEIIAEKGPPSIQLGIYATILALILGLGAGIIGGIRQNTVWDHSSMAVAMTGLSVPVYVVGPMLALVFGSILGLLPVAQYETILGTGWLAHPKYMVLPAVTLSLPFAARIARLTRAGMLDVINQDYIRTAWAKGLKEQVIVVRHALRGAMLPVVSFLGPAIAAVFTGSIVVEKVFGMPGLGTEFVASAFNRDYTLVMGTVILYGSLLILMNLMVDIAYGFLDPRIRYE